MEQRISLLASEATPHILTAGSEDDIEEIVRHSILSKHSAVRSSAPRHFRAPVRRITTEGTPGKSYQMFEVFNNNKRASMDGSDISCSSAATIATSATSSRSDALSASSGFVDEQEDDMAGVNWDEREVEQDDEDLIVPKLEPMDDADMIGLSPRSTSPTSETKESMEPDTPTNSTAPEAPAQVKRPRGRPRKHPKPTPESLSKVNKGRSKTGCITCRKRKKKCDETKPGCLNCEKNSVVCEGYPEKTIWRSGKEKNEEARLRRASSITLNVQLPFLIRGLETEGDRIFLHHYVSRLSVIFTLEGSNDSAFRNIMLPLAQQHSGLMHSILALSSKHLDYTSPYGLQVLREHPSVKVKELEERSQFHEEEAFKQLTSPQRGVKIEAPIYGQMLCLVLQTLSDPTPQGLHRPHLEAYQRLIQAEPPAPNDEVMKFFHEFFQYHIGADQIIHLPQSDVLVSTIDDWNLPNTVFQSSAVRMLGVFDNLFLYMSKITNIRNKIRQNIDLKVEPIVDYHLMYAAAEIDAGIREWTPVWPPGDARETAGLLYKQMMWIYLWRTIYPPQTTNWALHPSITIAVNGGIELLSHIGPKDPSQTLLLAPAFVIGCAAFEMEQREPIRKAISVVKSYMEYKNTDTALKVLEEVWRLMDARNERSWDWQSIAHGMGMDFLAT